MEGAVPATSVAEDKTNLLIITIEEDNAEEEMLKESMEESRHQVTPTEKVNLVCF